MIGAEQGGKKDFTRARVSGGIEFGGWVGVGADGVGVIVGVVSLRGGLKGRNFRFGPGGSAVTLNCPRRAQGQTGEYPDDGDHPQKFDQSK